MQAYLRTVLLLTVVMSVIGNVFAQGPSPCVYAGGSVVGQVVNSAGNAIPGTQVSVQSYGVSGVNSTGWFRLSNLIAGQNTLDISAPGYQSQQQSVDVVGCGGTVSVGQIVLAQSPQSTSSLPGFSGDLVIVIIVLVGLVGIAVGVLVTLPRRRRDSTTAGKLPMV